MTPWITAHPWTTLLLSLASVVLLLRLAWAGVEAADEAHDCGECERPTRQEVIARQVRALDAGDGPEAGV